MARIEPNPKALEMMGKERKDFFPPEVNPDEKRDAQILFTAIMTDTLLEEDEE